MTESLPFHTNPNPFTGNSPAMGFEIIGDVDTEPSLEAERLGMDGLSDRLEMIERMLGIHRQEPQRDSLSDLLFSIV